MHFKKFSMWFALTLATVSSLSTHAATALPRSTPEAQGISSEAIQKFVELADAKVDTMHSFMLLRHGQVVAEGWWNPYNPESPHILFSLSKSFTSTAVGLAVADGKLSIDDEVLKFFPEDAPAEPSARLKSMRVRDLLTMSTGHESEPRVAATNDVPWTKSFLAHPVPHKPGAHFLYNTPATYMQSAIVQKLTGQSVLDYLRPRLFEPLGIENPTWGTSPQGITLGGYGLSVRTEDIAKFGQLYLQKGQWNGKQLVPAAWVELATAKQVSNGSSPKSDWDQGYGFQFWRCRNGAYRGDGAFGQYCIVLPEQDAVIAITSGTGDMQNVMNIIWDNLLPAFQKNALPANEAANTKLKQTFSTLAVRMPEGVAQAPTAAANFLGKEFTFESNPQKVEAIKVESDTKGTTLTLKVDGKAYRLASGHQSWVKARAAHAAYAEQPVAVSGAWSADGSYTARLSFYETTTYLTITLKPSGNDLLLDAAYNVNFGPTKFPQLVGKLKP